MTTRDLPKTPPRSYRQRMTALERANEIRLHRSHLKCELRAGRKTLADLMTDPLCATMKVWDALLAIPKVGRVKANRTLLRMRISPSKTFGGLSTRQRHELAEAFA